MPVCLQLPREHLVNELAAAFPAAAMAPGELAAAARQPFRGGRAEAIARLAAVDPEAYARTRNDVGGAVSRLSPWIRHGVLSLAEVRDAAIARAGAEAAEKFVSELGWRDYWQLVLAAVGAGVMADLEPPAAEARAGRLNRVPADVLTATTGLACIDDFVRRLHATGWLHNHERMWLASWLVHVRGVHWRAGADWFISHLLDGDPASNHLSWQWVAGTFSAKPYIFNRANLERFTAGVHCGRCAAFGHCDLEGDYDSLADRLFVAGAGPRSTPTPKIRPPLPWGSRQSSERPLVWITLDSVSAESPAVLAHPDAPRVFVVADDWLAEERPALKRLVFLWECLADLLPIEVCVGEPASVLQSRAVALGCDGIAVAETACPRVRRSAAVLAESFPVTVARWAPFCDRSGVRDVGRFSRYWQAVKASALQPTPR